MALAAVTLHESLRPWRAAGLYHVLLDTPLADEAIAEPAAQLPQTGAPAQASSGAAAGTPGAMMREDRGPDSALGTVPGTVPGAASRGNAVAPAGASAMSPAGPRDAAQQGRASAAPAAMAGSSRVAPQSSQQAASSAASPAASPAHTAASPRAATPPASSLRVFSAADKADIVAAWPEPWQAAFRKSRPAPVVWSYHELGLDLAGLGSPDRGNFFRTLIGALRLPPGSSAFWPTAVSVPAEDGDPELTPDAAIYHAGLACLEAKVVVLLGSQGLADAEYGALPLYQQRVDAGRLIVHVPDLAKLMSGESQFRVALSFLQAALGFLV